MKTATCLICLLLAGCVTQLRLSESQLGARLRQAGVGPYELRARGDGGFEVKLGDVHDLSGLVGLPITHLKVNKAFDLRPLKEMELRSFDMSITEEAEARGGLSVLAELDLDELRLGSCPDDLSFLRGTHVRKLELHNSRATDLSPLADSTVRDLSLHSFPRLRSLSPLRGMRLKRLTLFNMEVTDISPLRAMPLTHLSLVATRVTDLRPLEGMSLEQIRVSPFRIERGLGVIRNMTSLRTINARPVAVFWAKYDLAAANQKAQPSQ